MTIEQCVLENLVEDMRKQIAFLEGIIQENKEEIQNKQELTDYNKGWNNGMNTAMTQEIQYLQRTLRFIESATTK